MSGVDDMLVRYTEKVSELLDKRSEKLADEELASLAQELGLSEEDIALAKSEARAHRERGEGYLKNGLANEAVAQLESAHVLAPNDQDVIASYARALTLRFEGSGQSEDRDAAERLAKRLLEDAPSDQRAFEVLKRLKKRPTKRPMLPLVAVAVVAVVAVGVLGTFGVKSTAPPPRSTTITIPAQPPKPVAPVAPVAPVVEVEPPQSQKPNEVPPATLPKLPAAPIKPQTVLPIYDPGGTPLVFFPGPSGEGVRLIAHRSIYDRAGHHAIDARLVNGSTSKIYALTLSISLQDAQGAELGASRVELESSGYRPGDLVPIFETIRSASKPAKVLVRLEGATVGAPQPLYPVAVEVPAVWDVSEPSGAALVIKQRNPEALDAVTVEVHNNSPKTVTHLEIEKRMMRQGKPAEVVRLTVAGPGVAAPLRSGESRVCDLVTENVRDATMQLHIVQYRVN